MSIAIQREIAKAKKILHPNSRKAVMIAKKTKKISNRQKAKMAGVIKQNLVGEKMMWIQQHMVPDVCPYTPELTAELLLKYIRRNDEELEQIVIKHSIGGRKNRQHASREDIIRMTKQREQEEFDTCGIEIPDILTSTQCEMLRNWNGELRLLSNFKFRRFGKKHLKDALLRMEKRTMTVVNKSTDNTKTNVSCTSEKIESTEKNSIEDKEFK
ncbi:translation machinery-associated protein 16 [Pseudomyrmex gracilis]|uniref:translation machinery-associated protein 16 n=1 Tax=Pseudomyrmex gracilis TaxID=219809 RepID=UPI0009958641|nr:translation machinery-associated protein 16 [Pseudomyrmex gracilis]